MWRRLPGFARAVLVLQLGVIVYMATWIYLEYLNNQYLQAYVENSLQANIPTLQTILPIFLAIGTITVYAKLLAGKKDLTEEYYQAEFEPKPPEIRTPSIPYPDEVTGPQIVRDPLPQLRAVLVSKKMRREGKRGRRTSRTSLKRRSRKRTRRPDVSGP